MSRRVATKAAVLGAGASPEEYLGRVVKYIPAEIVALYVSAIGVVPDSSGSRSAVLWGIFGFCAIATPIYMAVATSDKTKQQKPLWLQVVLASIAFMGATFIFGLVAP